MSVARLAPLLPHDAAPQQLETRHRFGCFSRRMRLLLQDLEPWPELLSQVLEPQQVVGELLQLLNRLVPSLLDAAHLGRLFEELAALGGRADDDVLDVVLVDDRVGVDRQSGRAEDVQEIAAADARAVEEVVALAVALDPSLDRHFVVVDWQPSRRVVEHHGDLGKRGPRATLAAGVDDLLHLLAAEVSRLAGAEDPLHGVDNVRLAGAVGPDDGGDTAVKCDLGLPGKRFEAQQLQGL